MGFTDGEKISFEQLLTLATNMVANVNIPVTVDIESGYADNINIIADNVLKIAEIGAVGINIEDSSKDNSDLLGISKQGEILTRIRNRLDNNGYSDFFINARTDTYFQLDNPIEETITRSTAYINSGANGLFVPVLSNDDEIKALVAKVNAPVNLMSLPNVTDVNHMQNLGVKRFSTGPAFSNAIINFIEKKSKMLIEQQNTESLYEDRDIQTIFK
jgi:2-methylisocitrate lyase-like PEP mutase family enzyme